MRALAATLAASLAAGCGAGDGRDGAPPVLVDGDHRYRLTLSADPPVSPDAPGALRVRVETAETWHVAEEAPAHLRLRADGLAFDPAEQGPDDATFRDEDGFEFVAALHAEGEGRRVAHAELRFGVCEEEILMCEVVQTELELPIRVSFR